MELKKNRHAVGQNAYHFVWRPKYNIPVFKKDYPRRVIEKAIRESDLGVNPLNDGKIIRIQLPQVSSERREELVKILGKKVEECKIAIRNTRKDFNNLLRDGKKDKTISENFYNRLCDVLQKVTDSYVGKADQMEKKKIEEITSI